MPIPDAWWPEEHFPEWKREGYADSIEWFCAGDADYEIRLRIQLSTYWKYPGS